jgi:hypothetical protein
MDEAALAEFRCKTRAIPAANSRVSERQFKLPQNGGYVARGLSDPVQTSAQF